MSIRCRTSECQFLRDCTANYVAMQFAENRWHFRVLCPGMHTQLYVEGDKHKSPTQGELEVLLRAAGVGAGAAASGLGKLSSRRDSFVPGRRAQAYREQVYCRYYNNALLSLHDKRDCEAKVAVFARRRMLYLGSAGCWLTLSDRSIFRARHRFCRVRIAAVMAATLECTSCHLSEVLEVVASGFQVCLRPNNFSITYFTSDRAPYARGTLFKSELKHSTRAQHTQVEVRGWFNSLALPNLTLYFGWCYFALFQMRFRKVPLYFIHVVHPTLSTTQPHPQTPNHPHLSIRVLPPFSSLHQGFRRSKVESCRRVNPAILAPCSLSLLCTPWLRISPRTLISGNGFWMETTRRSFCRRRATSPGGPLRASPARGRRFYR